VPLLVENYRNRELTVLVSNIVIGFEEAEFKDATIEENEKSPPLLLRGRTIL
jgi:hypothetical protein